MAENPTENELNNEGNSTEEVENSKKKKKEKKPKKEGGIPLLVIIGGALGGVVLIILSVIIGTIVANKLFPPQNVSVAETEHVEKTEKRDTNKEKLASFPDDEEYDSRSLLLSGEDWYSFKSNKITTNVKNSISTFAIMVLTIDYKIHFKEELTAKGFLLEGGKDSHGDPIPPVVDTTSALYQKLKQIVSSKVNDFIGTYTEQELQQMRTDTQLKFSDRFKEYLKPTFKDFGLIIGDVHFVEFMIAKQ